MQPECGAYPKKRNQKFVNFFVSFVLVMIFITMFAILLQMREEGGKCLQQPLIYGASKLASNEEAEVFCTCQLTREDGDYLTYAFDDKQENPTKFSYINFINLTFSQNANSHN